MEDARERQQFDDIDPTFRLFDVGDERLMPAERNPDGTIEVLADDPRLICVDTFWITPDRWLYVSSSQVNRRAEFNGGVDRVKPPFAMLRMRIDAGPA